MEKHQYKHNPDLTSVAQKLRRNMTEQEKRLWYGLLRGLSVTVYRQKIFENYIVDFYCHAAKLVIELDGSQHYEAENREEDAERDAYFQRIGVLVVRYSNADVNQRFQAVCQDIVNRIEERSGKKLDWKGTTSSAPAGAPSPEGKAGEETASSVS